MNFKKNIFNNLNSYYLMFLVSFLYILSTILHSLYLSELIENGNLTFLGLILLYLGIFCFEYLFLIKTTDQIIYNENNKVFDIQNIIYYVKNNIYKIVINSLILLIGLFLLNNLDEIFKSSFQFNKLTYLLYIPKFILYYITFYNIKNIMIDNMFLNGFIDEMKKNYLLSFLGILIFFLILFLINQLLIISNQSLMIRSLVSIPISFLFYIYHIFIFSFE